MLINITDDLATIKAKNVEALNKKTYDFITKDQKFPEWKQANYSDTWSVLVNKTVLTTEEQNKKMYIEAVRVWKDQLLLEINTAEALILNASNTADIKTALSNIVWAQKPVE